MTHQEYSKHITSWKVHNCNVEITSSVKHILLQPVMLTIHNYWQTPSWKSQAGTQVRISDLEFSLETHFPTIHPPIHPPTHPPTHPPGKVFVSYVGGRFLNKSCLSILVGIKNGYCNSWWPKYGPQVPKEWFESIHPLILWQSKTEWKLIADWGSKWRSHLFNVQFWIYKFLIS